MRTDPREEAAYDAIAAYSLAGKTFENLSDEEIEKELAQYPELSSEGLARLAEMSEKHFSRRAEPPPTNASQAQEVAGMYRDGSNEELSPELRDEIARKRENIRAQLRKRRGGNV